jgi:hypothetical protein
MTTQDKHISRIVVFDMDETLGYFVEFGVFWDSLNTYIKSRTPDGHMAQRLGQHEFNQVLDLYPEFIRPNIISILNYLKHKKSDKLCKGVMIYTNNQGPKEWAQFIKEYFEQTTSLPNLKLFDQIICAFKVNGRQVEIGRTTHDKTYNDFIRCTKIPLNTKICFLDDLYHPEMNNHNVYYIKLKPYVYNLTYDVMIQRFISSQIGKTLIQDGDYDYFSDFIKNEMNNFDFLYVTKNQQDYDIDKIITKKTMVHLQKFFSKKHLQPTTKSNRNQRNKKKKTAKLGFYRI